MGARSFRADGVVLCHARKPLTGRETVAQEVFEVLERMDHDPWSIIDEIAIAMFKIIPSRHSLFDPPRSTTNVTITGHFYVDLRLSLSLIPTLCSKTLETYSALDLVPVKNKQIQIS